MSDTIIFDARLVFFLIKSYFYICCTQSEFDALLEVNAMCPLDRETSLACNGCAGTLEWQQHCTGAGRLRPPPQRLSTEVDCSIPLVLHVHLLLGKGF